MRFVWLVIEVLTVALGVEIALRTRPLERVFSGASHPPARRRRLPETPVARLERAIRVTYRLLPFERTCLKHSLIFCRLRHRRGWPAELRLGVQKTGGVFAAHAWVEDDRGQVLTDPQEGFSPLPLTAMRDRRATD